VNIEEKAQEFFPALAESIFPLSFAQAQKITEDLKISQLPQGAKVLDVAAGAGTWTIPMALENSGLHVDALDFPAILEVTKRFAQQYGVADRYGYISGNWRNVPWQKEAYDIAVLGHILHSEGAELSKQLLKRCFEALKPGGRIVIGEFITNNDHSGPAPATLFGVNMLMHTEIGCVFSEEELEQMLTKAGFEKVQRMAGPAAAESMVICARKPG
jgi:ubiquinone/menaquinone biosynthesis C-methylase UbiE